jgi:streptogramin lyase
VQGGQQPVTGAKIYLFATGITGYTSAPVSLLTGAGVTVDTNGNGYVTTDATGSFTITGDYTCPSASRQVYVEALGGNPGLPGTVNNPYIALVSMAGQCGQLTPSTFIEIDEQTTTAAIYALAQFTVIAPAAGSGSDGFATSATNAAGLSTAVRLVPHLLGDIPLPQVFPSYETAGSPLLINNIADALAACVNTTGSSGECQNLVTAATPPAGSAPADTFQAVLNLMRNPTLGIAAINAMVTPTAPFQPTQSTTPASWLQTEGTGWFGGYCQRRDMQVHVGVSPQDNALDATGRNWSGLGCAFIGNDAGIVDYTINRTPGDSSLVYLRGNNNLFPRAIAGDTSGVMWWLDTQIISFPSPQFPIVMKMDPNVAQPTALAVARPSTAGSQLAFDPAGNLWITAGTSLLTGIPASATSPPTVTIAGNGTAVAMAFDPTGNLWTANHEGTVSKYVLSGTSLTSSAAFTGGGLSGPSAIAIDHSGNVWVANQTGNSLSKFDPSGNALSPAGGFTGGGLNAPTGIAVDGDGFIWVNNSGGYSVSRFDSTGAPTSTGAFFSAYPAGFTPASTTANAINIDTSGNVWLGPYALIGAAAPVISPFAVAVRDNKLGVRP